MDKSAPEHLRRTALRCHALSPSLASPADRMALDDYADVLAQQAGDMEHELPVDPASPAPAK